MDGAASAPFSFVGCESPGRMSTRPSARTSQQHWRATGRFAPSPTGPMHIGSLLAAAGSYLDARHHGARWVVRIEDLDEPRVVPGCADDMLRTLDAYGFEWDGEILYQSQRREAYEAATKLLDEAG